MERVGSLVTNLFTPNQQRDVGNVLFQDLMTLGNRMSGLAGPPRRAREGALAFTENPWVFGALSSIVNEAADTPLYIRKKVRGERAKDGSFRYEYTRFDEHQALDLMDHPMPDAELKGTNYMNGDIYKRLSMFFLIASGEFMWRINSRLFGQIPLEMQMIYPNCTDLFIDKKTGLITHYINYEDGKNEKLDPWDVVHVKMPNITNFYRGLSQLMAAHVPIRTESESDSWLWNWFKNRAIPDFIINRETAPKAGEIERFKVQWEEEHGGSENAGKMGVVWGGKVQEMSRSQRDMQFKELKEYNRDTIMASLRTGKGILGMMEDQSRANAEAQDYTFTKHVVKPFLTLYCKQLTTEFLTRFPNTKGMEICFENVVPEDLVTKSTVWGSALDKGAISMNEYRKEFGMDAREEKLADKLLVAMGKVPVDELENSAGGDLMDGGSELDVEDDTEIDEEIDTEEKGTDIGVGKVVTLNGAQVQAATDIVAKVVAGEMPRDSGIGQLMVLFNLTNEQAEQIMGSAGTSAPTTPNPVEKDDKDDEPDDKPDDDEEEDEVE